MSDGQGWARRVTKATLQVFAPFLRRAETAARERREWAAKREAKQSAGESPFKGKPFRVSNRFTVMRRSVEAGIPAAEPPAAEPPAAEPPAAEPSALARGPLLWRKRLNRSDAQDTPAGTNPTGCVRLTQARDENYIEIDQTTYFRDNVFADFPWGIVRQAPLVEATIVPFRLTIRGLYLGTFDMQIRHKPTGEAGQGNYTTSLHWGELTQEIRGRALAQTMLSLYAPVPRNRMPFFIEIA